MSTFLFCRVVNMLTIGLSHKFGGLFSNQESTPCKAKSIAATREGICLMLSTPEICQNIVDDRYHQESFTKTAS